MDWEHAEGDRWYKFYPDELLPRFNEVTLEILNAALGVYSKLKTVRPSSLFEYDDPAFSFFFEYGYGPQDYDDEARDNYTTWFWQAEQGKQLGTYLLNL